MRRNKAHHRSMASGAKGKGGDAKIREAKQDAGKARYVKPKREKKDEYDPA